MQEQFVQVGDRKGKKLGSPWKGSSRELVCRVDQQGQLYFDVVLLTDPPAIQSIAFLFCSGEELSHVSERVYQDYGVIQTADGTMYTFDAKSSVAKRIFAACNVDQLCEVEDTVDGNDIVSVSAVRKLGAPAAKKPI